MDKSPDAFRTISEVAEVLETPAHVLRFWESRFTQIRPVKRAGGRRYYRPSDVALLAGIKRLLHDEGLTIRGVQKILRDQGVRHVAGLSDDSVSVEGLIAPAVTAEVIRLDSRQDADAEDATAFAPDPVEEVIPEAGFIAIEDDEDLAPAAPATPVQSVLPLFDTPPAPKAAPRQPTRREDETFASLIRALPPKALRLSAPEIAVLARRLAALRAQLASRSEGGEG
ncbi:MerR family transcriptional regulator [Tabrizicola piscis]|uniref:MerR family transcriptional regulator n=1 Tax=Tabrizicola piscis TaxID=2494374 RepID=A0A3S8UBL4_9RHOB|nr:MerR family transcriptional regulator [Tabrizicola piscis]AZL60928.1 MerR family transcriptional regulator [Tabrizicola piscis]